jgi:beta-glucanase (GH16 family)
MYGPTSGADASVYSVSNGTLSLAIKPTPADVSGAVNGTPFLSGQLETRPTFSQLYGYFEINAQLPSGGSGISSAFWLLPESGAWPPELDVFEEDTSQGTHAVETGVFTNQSGSTQQINNWDRSLPDLSAGAHTFAVDWEPDTITWYIDGKQVFQTATPADMHQPMYMLIDDLTSAAGSWNGTPPAGLNTSMQVNWVHVYDSNPYVNGVNTVLGDTAVAAAATATTATDITTTPTATSTIASDITTTPAGSGTTAAAATVASTTSAQPILISPGNGTFTDSLGNVYSISTTGGAEENGKLMSGGNETAAMEFANGSVYGQDVSTKQWYTWNQSFWTAASAPPSAASAGAPAMGGQTTTTTADTTSAPATDTGTGDFQVSNGQITGPDGQPFKAQGIDILDSTLGSVVGDASGGVLLQQFPNINMVRIATESGYGQPSQAFINAVNWLTAKGIVVEIGNYNDGNGQVATGAELNAEVAWYKSLATMFVNNPYVWFTTANEPEDASSGGAAPAGSVTAEQVAVYNAIRGVGNNNQIALEGATQATLNPAAYANMTNVHWDVHYYNWESGYSTDVNANVAKVNQDIAKVEAIHSADGTIPVILGEFGNATDGTNVDPGGTAAVQAVINTMPQFSGWDAWLYYWPGDLTGDELVDQNTGQLTAYGQQIATAMTAANAPTAGGTPITPPTNPAPAVPPPTNPPPTNLPPASTPVTTGTGSDTLVLGMSEDAYQGDAQFTVSVDGKQLGGTFTATASHAAGASQDFTFNGNFGTGQHTVSVDFLNDAYGGSSATDRNLYVNGISYDGAATGQAGLLFTNGTRTFTVADPTAPSISETGDHGSLAKTLSQTGTYTVGGDTFVLSTGNSASAILGAGSSQITFVGASSIVLAGGSGQATVKADAGNNTFVAGTGSLDVTGGSGKDSYVFHAGSGLLSLDDFSVAKGDTLIIDKALQGSLQQTSDGQGGTMLSFGTGAGHGVDIHGVAAMPSTNVVWA